MKALKYKRILLKLSGEILAGNSDQIVSPDAVNPIVKEICEVYKMGAEIAIVIGAGNIVRGNTLVKKLGVERTAADYTGMLGTVINGMILQGMIEQKGIETRMMTAINIAQIAEPYIKRKAISHLKKKRIVIFTAGTGNPFFTTDTAAVLRAVEINADVVLKGTKVEGVFNVDPVIDKKAVMFSKINYKKVISDELNVMDLTAISLSKENNIPIIVYNSTKYGNLKKIIKGSKVGTLVS